MEELKQCPECLEMVNPEELEMFDGICEECNFDRIDVLQNLLD